MAKDQGLKWCSDKFKCLGINFSLNLNTLFDLNFKTKLLQIEQTLNCWRARGLSLIGKICVIKSLMLPQLLYLFSVLCIKLPESFFKTLNKLFLISFGVGVKIGLKEIIYVLITLWVAYEWLMLSALPRHKKWCG